MLKPRILVVDDEETLRNLLQEVMQEEGLDVETAVNGKDALEKFKQRQHNIIFTDLKMPGVSGIELLKAVKAEDPDTEVIIITSHGSLATAVEAVRLGAYEYLIKPFEDISASISLAHRAFEKYKMNKEKKLLLEDLQRKNQELEKVNMTIKELASKDGLTGLYNHRHFQEILSNELHRAKRHQQAFSLIFLDVDYFKHYNDTNGHPMGDEVLKTVGHLIKTRIRSSDIPARYGGEEFIILLPETPLEAALQLAEEIRKSVEKHPFPNDASQPNGKLTISLGVAEYPRDGQDVTALLQHVDEAMYHAKENGKNRVCGWATSPGSGPRETTYRYLN
jgi:diguanylate cyclase (GGDEF)-like protein